MRKCKRIHSVKFKKTIDIINLNIFSGFVIVVVLALLSTILISCSKNTSKSYTIGIVNCLETMQKTIDGFKDGMTELGYIEAKNIHYIYDGATTDTNKLLVSAHSMISSKVDMILSITTPATLAAKEATTARGGRVPVVFTIVTDPVGAKIVESMLFPGGNITGVTFGFQETRRLEWLLQVAPEIKHIYIPYNINDKSPALSLNAIKNTAEELGVELITRKVSDLESLDYAVSNIPIDADAVFLLPDSLISSRLSSIAEIANKQKLPTSGASLNSIQDDNILISFGCDFYSSGKQSARIADHIFKGANPSDFPVEISEFYLGINLKVANDIGLTISDDVLRQAHVIVR